MKIRQLGKSITAASIALFLAVQPVWAGGYVPETTPAPESIPDVVFPENDSHAGMVALVLFGIVFVVGIVQILTRKWQNRSRDDKE